MADFYGTENVILPSWDVSGSNFTSSYMGARGYSNVAVAGGGSVFNTTYAESARSYNDDKVPALVSGVELRHVANHTVGATYRCAFQAYTQNNNAVPIGGNMVAESGGGPSLAIGTDVYNTWLSKSDDYTPTGTSVSTRWAVTTGNGGANVVNRLRLRAFVWSLL